MRRRANDEGGGRATEEGSRDLCASSADVARDVGATRATRGDADDVVVMKTED